jgi:hypothetical protein
MHRLNETLLAWFLQCNGYGFHSYQIMGRPDRVLLQEYNSILSFMCMEETLR